MEASLPEWAQTASVIAIALISTVIGVFKYLKTEAGKIVSPAVAVDPAATVTATFLDSKLLKDVIEQSKISVEENQREGGKNRRSNQELRESIQELTEVMQVNVDTTLNLLKFIRSRDRQKDMDELDI